jgi:hypothetical protein
LDLSLIESLDRRIIWLGVLLSCSCLAYFYLLDHFFSSGSDFSPIFRLLLTTYDFNAAWIAAAICVLAAAWKRPAPILVLVDFLAARPYLAALTTVVVASVGAVLVYRSYPFSMDEYAAVFQAKIFASGHLYAQFPVNAVEWLVVRGFNGAFLIASPESGKAIEGYWPGFSLLLAAFEFLKARWLANATLAGLTILLIYWITKQITQDRRAPGWAILFTLASGAFTGNAISLYSMQAHLTLNLLFVLMLVRPTKRRALAAGLVGSLALILHNPVPHALFAAPWIVSLATDRDQRRYVWLVGLGYAPGLMLGLGWLLLRADIGAGAHDLAGLGDMASAAFTWPNGILLNMRAAAMIKMLVWALPGLFLLAFTGYLRHRDNRHVRLLAQSAMLTFVGYLFVRFDQGHGWGYRYFHSAWGTIPILAACAMVDKSGEESRLVSFAGAAAVLSALILVPFQMGQIHEVISQHLAQLPLPVRPGNNIYFIHPRGGFYIADMVQVDPFLRDRDLTLVSRGGELDTQLVQQNWPNAIRIAQGEAADQWYLGPKDQRIPISGGPQSHFVFRQIPSPPSAEGR